MHQYLVMIYDTSGYSIWIVHTDKGTLDAVTLAKERFIASGTPEKIKDTSCYWLDDRALDPYCLFFSV